MTNKKDIKKSIHNLQRIKTWQLFVIFILVSFLAATFLRLNNMGMVERRTAVISADELGDDIVTQNRLYDLQRYVTSHMNTDMGKGIYLTEARKRDAEDAYSKASASSNPNGNIYKKAQEACAPKFSSYSYAYLQCTTNELAKYPAGSDLIGEIELPPAEAYLHIYYSPLWSPDFAGWAVILDVVILIMIFARVTSVMILKSMLRRRHKGI